MMQSENRDTERGATLLSVLLLIVLMSTAALAATDALARSVHVSRVSTDRADRFWAARGAISVGEVIVNELLAQTNGKLDADSAIFAEPIRFTYPRGVITVDLYDATNCLNLNSLVLSDAEDAGGTVSTDQLHRLLEGAGLFSTEAREMVDTLADWMDADSSPRAFGGEDALYFDRAVPHRTPGQRLVSRQDLRAIKGYTPETRAAISDLVCVRSDTNNPPMNINTLTESQAPLLAARLSEELSVSEAERLILSRPSGGWLNVEEFLLSENVVSIAPELRRDHELSTVSSVIGAIITVSSGTGDIAIDALYGRGDNGRFVLLNSHRSLR